MNKYYYGGDRFYKARCYYAVEAGDTETVAANLLLIMHTGIKRCVICGDVDLLIPRKFTLNVSGTEIPQLTTCNACGLGMIRIARYRESGTYVRRT